jgi:hypothetical protein
VVPGALSIIRKAASPSLHGPLCKPNTWHSTIPAKAIKHPYALFLMEPPKKGTVPFYDSSDVYKACATPEPQTSKQ